MILYTQIEYTIDQDAPFYYQMVLSVIHKSKTTQMLTFFLCIQVWFIKKTQKITKNCTQFLPVIFKHFSSAANKATKFWLSIERFPNGLTLMMMMMSVKLIISRFGMNELDLELAILVKLVHFRGNLLMMDQHIEIGKKHAHDSMTFGTRHINISLWYG